MLYEETEIVKPDLRQTFTASERSPDSKSLTKSRRKTQRGKKKTAAQVKEDKEFCQLFQSMENELEQSLKEEQKLGSAQKPTKRAKVTTPHSRGESEYQSFGGKKSGKPKLKPKSNKGNTQGTSAKNTESNKVSFYLFSSNNLPNCKERFHSNFYRR